MAESIERSTEKNDKVQIVGRHFEVTAPMQMHIHQKLQKVEEITPQVIDVVVYLEIQREDHRAEIMYKFSHFSVIVHATTPDMYQSFDLAVAKLKQKLRKWKSRIQDHHGKKLSEVEMSISVLDRQKALLDDINDQIEEETLQEVEEELKPPKVVKTEKKTMPMLTMGEAAMRIELMEEHFLVYRAEEDQKIKVMYVRPDHTLGVVEVE